MMSRGLIVWKAIRVQVLLLSLTVVLAVLSSAGVLPSQSAVITWLSLQFQTYGLIAVAIVALFEYIVGFNAYFPGSVVILTGMALTGGNPPLAILTFVTIAAPALVAQAINFQIGRSLGGKTTARRSVPSFREYLATCWHPHLGAISAVRAGAEGETFERFAKKMLPALLFWSVFWAITMYNIGSRLVAASSGTLWSLFLVYLIFWAVLDTRKALKAHVKAKKVG